MKYLLVLFVIAIGFWMVSTRSRRPASRDDKPKSRAAKGRPQEMVRCAHCGLHLPAADAVADGALAYCTDEHRRLGPGPEARR
jgi:uncharacterized protein